MPEAYMGGLIAYVKNGDKIVVDMKNKTIDLYVSDSEIAHRKKTMKKIEHPAPKGVLERCRREAMARYS
jgi:dihydroxy-acid dehydratase